MYTQFYRLNENPFNVTSDPDFLFPSSTHKEALEHLIYGINQRKGFVEITGEIGSGKTTLCRALINRLDSRTKTSLILNSSLPENQLLEEILFDFGIAPERRSKGLFLRRLNEFLLEQLSLGNNTVLIIDEAQNLRLSALETIRMLSNLETNKEKLLQIVLVGQPQLHDKLKSSDLIQLRQRISVRFHIRALEKDEMRDYVYHRLSVAGSKGDIVFSPEAIEAIFEYSKGIPRLTNLVCDKALLYGFVEETHLIESCMIEKGINEIEGINHFVKN
ncbi:MAG: AAA family ATPase [Candidatus Omnitrophota bacterium]